MNKIHQFLLLGCSVIILLFALKCFVSHEPWAVYPYLLSQQMLEENQQQMQQATQKRQNEQAARRRAELEVKMVECESDEECIIVDKDPCGCLKGPESVTTINANYSLEFSRLVEKKFATATACPSVGSSEGECSASAHAVCQAKHCKIVY